MIRVDELTYKYPESSKAALDSISFSAQRGELIGITGKNGAGKTTLCYALCGLVPHFFKGAYGGHVFIGNKEVFKHEIASFAGIVGLVLDQPFSQMTGAKFTVYEEIGFGLENMGIPPKEMHERIRESMELLGITHLQERNPFSLSGGQMQRVAISSVVAMKPDILILDEPTSQLDPASTEEIFLLARSLVSKGMTVIITEHKTEKLAAYADRILLLDEGKLVQDGLPGEILARKDLEHFGIEPPDAAFAGMQPVDIQRPPLSNRTAAIELDAVRFSYPSSSEGLKGISLRMEGEPVAIVGENGAGKSTLMKLLKGLIKPGSGRILINGSDISRTTAAKLARDIGLVFQNPSDQLFKSTVLEEVMFGPLNIGYDKKAAEEMALQALRQVGLEQTIDENPYDLSFANRKLVSIASVVAMDTDIILFDEPIAGLDYPGRKKVQQLIRRLHGEGKLVVCILHDMRFVQETFGRTVVLAAGSVLVDGKTEEVFRKQDVLAAAGLEPLPSVQI